MASALPAQSRKATNGVAPERSEPETFQIKMPHGPAFICSGTLRLLEALPPGLRTAIPAGCFGGGCGICRIRILEGRYRRGAMSRARVTLEDEHDNIALACQVYPLSDLVIEPVERRLGSGTAARARAAPSDGETV